MRKKLEEMPDDLKALSIVEENGRYYLRRTFEGKQREHALGANRRDAKGKATRFIATAETTGYQAALEELKGKKVLKRGDDPTFKQMSELYREFNAQSGKPVAANTMKHNLQSLGRLMDLCGARTVSAINPDKLRGKPIKLGPPVRAAASMFKKSALNWYRKRGIQLFNPFAGMELPSEKPDPYIPLGEEVRKEMWRKSRELPPVQRIIVLLALGAGLRREEIDKARLLWLKKEGGKYVLSIRKEKDFEPKSRQARLIPVSVELAEEILSLRDKSEPFYLLPGTEGGELRMRPQYDAVYDWLRQFGIEDDKPLHVLRKECGSVVATEHGIFVASTVLGHSSVVITQNHYGSLVSCPTIDMDALIAGKPKASPLEQVAAQYGIEPEKLKKWLEANKSAA